MAMLQYRWWHRFQRRYHTYDCTGCGRRFSVPTRFTVDTLDWGCRVCGSDVTYAG